MSDEKGVLTVEEVADLATDDATIESANKLIKNDAALRTTLDERDTQIARLKKEKEYLITENQDLRNTIDALKEEKGFK